MDVSYFICDLLFYDVICYSSQQLQLATSLGNDLARSVWEATSGLSCCSPPDYTSCTRYSVNYHILCCILNGNTRY